MSHKNIDMSADWQCANAAATLCDSPPSIPTSTCNLLAAEQTLREAPQLFGSREVIAEVERIYGKLATHVFVESVWPFLNESRVGGVRQSDEARQ